MSRTNNNLPIEVAFERVTSLSLSDSSSETLSLESIFDSIKSHGWEYEFPLSKLESAKFGSREVNDINKRTVTGVNARRLSSLMFVYPEYSFYGDDGEVKKKKLDSLDTHDDNGNLWCRVEDNDTVVISDIPDSVKSIVNEIFLDIVGKPVPRYIPVQQLFEINEKPVVVGNKAYVTKVFSTDESMAFDTRTKDGKLESEVVSYPCIYMFIYEMNDSPATVTTEIDFDRAWERTSRAEKMEILRMSDCEPQGYIQKKQDSRSAKNVELAELTKMSNSRDDFQELVEDFE